MPGKELATSAQSKVTDAEFDSAYAVLVQEKAQEHLPMAVETLAELASGHKAGKPKKAVETTPATRRAAANDLIQHGHNRSVGKQADIERALSGGIHITINEQGGTVVQVTGKVVDEPRVIEADFTEVDEDSDE